MPDASQTAAAEAIKEAVPWHTVGIIARSEAGIPEQGIGTGAAVEWRGHSLILTAKHVIENTPHEELWFLLRPDGTLETAGVRGVNPAAVERETRRRIPIQSVVLNAAEDIALLEIEVTSTSIGNLRFHALDGNAATPPPGETVIVMGFPSDLGYVVAPGAVAAFPSMQATFIEQPRSLHNHDPSSHFLVKHEFATEGVHPRGCSGGGVWFRRSITTGIWHANLALAGIVTNYYPQSQLLEALKIEQIISFLQRTYPEAPMLDSGDPDLHD